MIELVQFPWSPFCIVQRRILEFAGARFKVTNVPNGDRTLVWRLTRQRSYGVPLLCDGRAVIFETEEDSQVLAQHLDAKFGLDLFPVRWAGVQELLWRHIESEVEGAGFKLNDIYWEEMVPKSERLVFLRHKERKFGRGCLDRWRAEQAQWIAMIERSLAPYEQMLATRDYLLEDRPRFVDFDLYGMLANFLYSGHYRLPAAHPRLAVWYPRMARAALADFTK